MAQPDITITMGVEGEEDVKKALGKTQQGISKFARIATATIAAVGIGSLAKNAFQLASALEQTTIQFEQFTGSAEAASRTLKDIDDFAASTPFQFQELADSGRQLLAFNIESEKLLPTLRRIGDIAAGTGNRVSELAEIYGKARVQGRLFGEDINQLTGRGIPIIGELAKQFGVAESEIKKLVAEGKVGFPAIEKAFISLTSAGGKFAGLTQRLSESTSGRLSTLRDNFSKLLRTAGEKALPLIADAADTLTKSIQRVFFGMKDVEGGSQALDNVLTNVLGTFEKIVTIGKGVIEVLKGIATALAAPFKFLDSTGTSVKEFESELSQAAQNLESAVFANLQNRLKATDSQMQAFRQTVTDFNIDIKKTEQENINPLVRQFAKWNEETFKVVTNITTLAATLGGKQGSSGVSKSFKSTGDSVVFAAGSIGFLQEKIKSLNEEIAKQTTREGVAALNSQIFELQTQIDRLTGTFGQRSLEAVAGLEPMNTALITTNQIVGNIRLNSDSVLANLTPPSSSISKIQELRESLRGIGTEFKQIGQDALVSLAGGLGQAFGKAIAGTEALGDSLKKLGLEIVQAATQAAGLALIQLSPTIPSPGSFVALGLGLGLLGLSGLLSGLGSGLQDTSGTGGTDFANPSPSPTGPGSTGLSDFTGTQQEFQPVFNVDAKFSIGEDEFVTSLDSLTTSRNNRSGR